MSSLLFLNPNLTQEEAMRLHKMQCDAFADVMKSCTEHVKQLKTQEQRQQYHDIMWPILMQQFAACL